MILDILNIHSMNLLIIDAFYEFINNLLIIDTIFYY